ncbi:putative secreted protein (Por secretion system target) [Lacinutrix venerupis]|uniref:zinc-dependent metalloprotease n=1 Tax=Lacinutrix venerupis TaxID=1486034 RepID=UPI000EAE144C|nr:zinc-dependent metalloprotease family protein [Lacinutrix venerupis]RLJ63379.1 putative secreted protein (Por secretion system target) [Lacinutrix venerupis]
MKKLYFNWFFTLVLSVLLTLPAFSQNGKSFWTKTSYSKASNNELVYRKTEPNKAEFYQLDINALKQQLQNAPNRNNFAGTSNVIVDFPTAEGTFESYRVKEAPVMEEALQNKYPQLRTYIGESVNTPGTVIRFSITPQGLHTMSMSNNNGTQFIDPYSKNNNDYIVYSKKDLPMLNEPWECGVIEGEEIYENRASNSAAQMNANDGLLRNFRLAIATTIEYSSFHWMAAGLAAGDTEASKKVAVMAAIVVTINRNNQIYERDLSITMTLVANNDTIVFINSDNFNNDNAGTLINQSQTVIDGAIGTANYDIGHTFSTGGGGLAQLNSPCTGNKARGITGLPAPVGDAYDVDFVAHELGHQFGAPHTFNGNTGNCAGSNREATNAYEPGSGTTIMAYAGICAPQNVQSNSDAYFHQKSLQMIWDNVFSGNSQCATTTPTGNSAPTSNAGSNYTIPKSTPYMLTGSSTDTDGTATHTYTWEQYDLGPAGLPEETNFTGPMVRSFEGTSSPTRVIPQLASVVANGGVSTTWEKLASVARSQNFRLTVRDNDATGGQTAVDEMTVNVNAVAGPFIVTSQDTDQIVWTPGSTETITWDVAGTTGNGINESSVDILLSTSQTQDAEDFDVVLATNVPNTGSYNITVPSNISAPYCRIMVKASNNIFFNVNDEYFAVGNYTYGPGDVCQDYFFAANTLLEENDATFGGFILTVNDSKTISDLNISVDVTTTNNAELAMAIRGPFGDQTNLHFLQSGTNNGCAGLPDALITYDDEGIPNACTSTSTNLSLQPLEPLSFADGENSLGDWIFNIGDIIVDGNRATWNSLTLTICETGNIPILGTTDFDLENSFSVFPNPNNGEFNIKFNSVSNDIAISIFDVRGRSVYNKSYTTSGAFNEAINLGDVQSGMYLLNVKDGDRTITKKIIVE